jgi:hypothetical protein
MANIALHIRHIECPTGSLKSTLIHRSGGTKSDGVISWGVDGEMEIPSGPVLNRARCIEYSSKLGILEGIHAKITPASNLPQLHNRDRSSF